jgi:thioester reductase-like protein
MGLESFEETHIAGTRRVIDFSASATYHPHIIFISSIASTGNWHGSGHTGFVPEVFMQDNSLPFPQGYGESKHVASSILAIAAKKSNIASTIVRVGQLAGPCAEKGLWNRQEWLPSIVASSKAMGKIPRTLGNEDIVDWVPTDAAAKVLLDICETRLRDQKEHKLDTFHLVNPRITHWKELVPAIVDFYSSSASSPAMKIVEFSDWLTALQTLDVTEENMRNVPGIKLLDFYAGLGVEEGSLPRLDTKRSVEASGTLGGLGAVDKKLMVNWCRQWGF